MYELYKTDDQSFTLFNSKIGEHYHSYAGAYNEAFNKYFKACKINEILSKRKTINIFEVGYGLGFNLLPLFDCILNNSEFKINFTSSEYDKEVFASLLKNSNDLYPDKYRRIFNILNSDYKYKDSNLSIEILIGDVRKTIKNIASGSIDALYHDPFSPYKNSECWTLDFFSEEFRIMNNEAILSTYSMSTPARSAMFQSGFYLYEGVGDARKTTGTIASKALKKDLPALSDFYKKKLIASPDRIPFRDATLGMDHLEIKAQRLQKKALLDFSDIVRSDIFLTPFNI